MISGFLNLIADYFLNYGNTIWATQVGFFWQSLPLRLRNRGIIVTMMINLHNAVVGSKPLYRSLNRYFGVSSVYLSLGACSASPAVLCATATVRALVVKGVYDPIKTRYVARDLSWPVGDFFLDQ